MFNILHQNSRLQIVAIHRHIRTSQEGQDIVDDMMVAAKAAGRWEGFKNPTIIRHQMGFVIYANVKGYDSLQIVGTVRVADASEPFDSAPPMTTITTASRREARRSCA